MATIIEIVEIKWPGANISITGDSYASMVWRHPTIGKPSEAEIRGHSADVDQILAIRDRRAARVDRMHREGDMQALLLALLDAVLEIRAQVKPAALNAPLNFPKLTALRDKLKDD